MATLKERHAEARAGIEIIKGLGIEPREIQPYLYQRFLRNGFDIQELPIYKKYDLSFQLNYDKPKDKKNNKFVLDSAQTYKVYLSLDKTEKKLTDGVIDGINDYFGHKSLTKDLDIQGIEFDEYIVDWDLFSKLTDGFFIENNDKIEFDLQFLDGKGAKKGSKYGGDFTLTNFL